ncbi:hypothetical protein LAZ67_15002970, partial [Cordylochernes scorpioides]
MSQQATNLVWAGSPSKAEQGPVRHGLKAQSCAELSAKQDLPKKFSNSLGGNQKDANPPTGVRNANLAAARGDVTTGSAAGTSSNGAARVLGNWADYTEDQGPGEDDDFTVVKNKKRRRESPGSPAAAAPSSGTRGAGATRRPRSSTGWAPRAEEVRTTRAHIAEARARQASSTEDHCVFVERSPELEPYHYMRVIDRMFGSTREVFQVTKMTATSLWDWQTKAWPSSSSTRASRWRELSTWPSRSARGRRESLWATSPSSWGMQPCRGQGHRRVNCPLLAGRTTAPGQATPTSPTSVPPATAPRLPQQPSARPPPPASPSSTMEVSDVPPASRAAPLPPAALQPSPPAPSALPLEDTPPAPPPVTPAPSLRTPGSREPAAPTPDVEMSIVEETFASSTSSAKNATRVDLDAFIEGHPSVSFAETDALGLGREEVLDLLSSRTKAQRKGPLLSPPQCDALVSLIGQILDLRPGAASNLYKVLGQVKAELRTTPAVPPTPTLPAPWPAKPTPPALHGEKTSPDIATPPPPLSTEFIDACYDQANDIIYELSRERYSEPLSDIGVTEGDIVEAIIFPEDREPLFRRLSTQKRTILTEIIGAAIERARSSDPFSVLIVKLSHVYTCSTRPWWVVTACTVSTPHVYTCSTRPWWVVTACTVSAPHVYTCSTRPWWVVTVCTVSTPHVYTRPRVARAPEFFASGGRKVSRMATNFIRIESPSKAEQKPVRHGSLAQPCAKLSANQDLQNEIPIALSKNQNYVNPPAGGQDANSAAPVDLAAIPTSNAAAQVRRNWADITEEVNPGAEEGFTLVQGRKRRRGSGNSPTTAAPSSNAGASRTIRRPQSSAGSVPRAQEIRATRAHIADARARQASSSEEHCVYIEHSPELEPFHYLRALDRKLGGTAGVIQITEVNGHQLLGLTNRGLAERLISEGLEVEGTLLRAFPFRKRAERITVGNLPFFVADSAVITALSPYGRVTSIAPKQMKAGPYVYVDGRRDVFITLHEGITIERLPTRLDINIKGQAWPAYLSSGIRCSRCHGQGHRRAICPLLAGLANNTRTAPPTTPAGVPPPTTPAPPQRSAAQPPAPTPSNPAMEVCSAPPVARAALHSSAPRPSPPAAPAFPMEETPPAPPPVTPAPSLQTPGSREPAAPTPDVEMSIVEETFASSTSSAKNATRVDLDAFIEGLPSVSFAKTDALGLGREEVLDLLSSRTKAQRKGPLLSPPQCDALVGLIGQILDLKPGHTSNLYKVLGQVKAELRTTPAVPPTPPLPAPRPSGPTPPTSHSEELMPAVMTPPPPALEDDPDLTQWQITRPWWVVTACTVSTPHVYTCSTRPWWVVTACTVSSPHVYTCSTRPWWVVTACTVSSPHVYTCSTRPWWVVTACTVSTPHVYTCSTRPWWVVTACTVSSPHVYTCSTRPWWVVTACTVSTPHVYTCSTKPWWVVTACTVSSPHVYTCSTRPWWVVTACTVSSPHVYTCSTRPWWVVTACTYQVMVGSDSLYCKYTTCLHSAVRPRVARAPGFSPLASCEMSLDMPNSASPGSPGSAGQMPGRPSIQSPTGGKISKNNEFQKVISKENSEHQEYANPPAGVRDANLAAARDDVTAPLTAASCSATVANPASLSWGDSEMADMDVNNGFTTVRTKKRRRVSPGSLAAAAPSSGTRGAGATRRPRSSTGWAPRAEEVRTTRAHIAEPRARQASSTEDHCVYIERSPELEPYHYMRALDRMLGGTREIFQMTKMNGHFLVGLANRGLAERLVNEGLEVEGTLHRAFPFRKRAEKITVGNLPFFVGDAAVISALSSFGRVTSIAPKLMKAGPYIYNDGRREAFIILREGMTIERLPTRLDITIKGEAWPAYLSSGIRCSRCRGQGHRRANCPLLARRTTAPGPATPTSPTSVPPATAPGLPQQPSAQPPPPASPSPTMEVSDVPPTRRAALHPPEALRQSPPAPSALPAEDAPPAPPPVTPAPSLRTPGSREPAAPTPDVEMSIVEETFASSTSSAKNATRVDLDAFIEGLPSVSFAKTDALGLGREEVLDLLSSRTKAQRKGPLLSPPQCDALVGLIGQILDLKPGHTSNLYKVLGQVKAELRTTPAVPPTPTLPAPRPDGPIPPPPHGDTTTPDMATSPSPLSTQMDRALMDKRWEALRDLMHQLDLEFELDLEHRFESRVDEDDIIRAILYPGDREPLIKRLPTRDRYTLGGLTSTAIRRARELDPSILECMSSSASPGSSGSAGQEPARPSIPAPTGGRISSENGNQKIILKENSENRVYANPPAGVKDVNLAAARDVTLNLPAGTSSNGAARVSGNWADCIEDLSPGAEDDFNVVKTKKRRRESSNSPTAAAPSSNSGGARSSRRLHSSARSVPRAQEIPTTRTHITEARARQASSSEEHCVYLEHGPELQPFHYLRALDRLLGGTAGIIQISKVNGHQLLGLANRDLAERLINNGLEVEGTLLRAFPFRKRAERITVGNLPFFVEDSAIIKALGPYGRITSIAPKMMKAGPYIYTDGRREAFIVLHEGVTTERLPTRLNITIKGEAWPAYLSSGIKCSRCHGQGHRRANCPLLAGRTTAPGPATPTSPTSVPPVTAPRLPQQPSTQPPPPASPSPTMEVSDVPPTSRAALHPPAALRQSPPAPSALPAEDAPPAPPPVTPAPSLRTPGSREPAAPTPDVEMSIVEETFASSTSSAKNATRVDHDAFIEELPSVSFAKTDALGLGREEVLDLLSSRTKAQRKGPLLSPPQCDALVGLIGQILDLKPGHTSNLYKVLGQVRAELTKTPAAAPTPPLPAPRPDGPIPPPPHGDTTTPDMATSPSPLSTQMDRALMDKRWEALRDLMHELDLEFELDLEHRFQSRVDVDDIIRAILYPGDREPLIKRLPTRDRYTLGGLMSTAIRRARELDPSILE